jgi:uncharacterized protein YkwD
MARFSPFLLVFVSLVPAPVITQDKHEETVSKIEPPKIADESGKRPDYAAAAKLIVESTNAFRKQEGRQPVAVNKELAAAAEYFAKFMAKEDKYGHTADGSRPSDRAKKHGYDYCIVLENIAYLFSSKGYDTKPLAEGFFEGWKNSPGHRRNMLDPDATETAVAVARSEATGHYYAVQMFGRPKSAAIVFKVENRSGQKVNYSIGEEKFDLEPRMNLTHTRCRPEDVNFQWSKGDKPDATVRPANGETYVVTKEDGKFAVKRR